jgi:hypothetical protein
MYKLFRGVCSILAVAALPSNLAAEQLNLRTWPDEPGLIRVRRETDITYEMLARNPEKYVNSTITVKGRVVQAIDDGGASGVLRLNVTPDKNFRVFTDTVWVDFERPGPGGVRVLEGDIIEFSGEFAGLKSYQAVSGATIYIPRIKAGDGTMYLLK